MCFDHLGVWWVLSFLFFSLWVSFFSPLGFCVFVSLSCRQVVSWKLLASGCLSLVCALPSQRLLGGVMFFPSPFPAILIHDDTAMLCLLLFVASKLVSSKKQHHSKTAAKQHYHQ